MPVKQKTIRTLKTLLAAYRTAPGAFAAATIAKRATGNDLFWEKLDDEDSRVTLDACDRMEQWLSDNWLPDGDDWPADIWRPKPTKGSKAA